MTLLAITLVLVLLALVCDDATPLAFYQLRDWRQRHLRQRRAHVVKPLSPLQRALIAERAAAINNPITEETHDQTPKVCDLRSVEATMRRAS